MKKIFLLIILFFMFCYSSKAEPQTPEEFTGSLLWKVSGNGLEKASYIFGTLHLAEKELIDSIPGLAKVIQEANQIVTEMTLSELNTDKTEFIMMPEDKNYKDILSKEEYTRLDNVLKKELGVGLEQLSIYKPAVIASSFVSVTFAKINPSFNPYSFEGIDSYIMRIAEENNKKVIGLETSEYQLNIAYNSKGSLERKAKHLLCSLESIDSSIELFITMIKDYMVGNLYKMLQESSFDPCSEYASTSKEEDTALMKERNDNWMSQLPTIIQEDTTLIAVGALHLAGEDGLLYQFHRLGYKVEAVKN